MNNIILYLIGFAGTGKLTIAKAILERAPFLLVDNHFINNVVFRLIDTDGNGPLPPKVWEHVGKVRSLVFDTMRDLSKPGSNFVLTNELVEGAKEDEQVFQEVKALATGISPRAAPHCPRGTGTTGRQSAEACAPEVSRSPRGIADGPGAPSVRSQRRRFLRIGRDQTLASRCR